MDDQKSVSNNKKINTNTLKCNTEKKNNVNVMNDKNTTEIDKKEKKIIDLEKNILNIKNDINNIQLRGQAEIENIRKKSEKDIKIIKNTQLKEFSKKILPIIDALDEICTISAQNKIQETTMIQGIILTRKSMLNIIQKFGIKREGEKNTIFQPNLHQSVSSKISETIQSNHITAVIKHGYTLNGILLRKAIVETSL